MASSHKASQLLLWMEKQPDCAVAFSGGVDSAVVAKAARLSLGNKALAVTGVSASLAAGELENAQAIARLIGIRHEVLRTGEVDQPQYARNDSRRCYYCKTELYTQLSTLAKQLGFRILANGANQDDLGDYRPGLQAAQEFQIKSPLAECGFNKEDVRSVAAEWNLPVWNKPASPCLSSRIAYGEEVTPDRLQRVDRAEQYLRNLGLAEVRVRYHAGDLARIEAPLASLEFLSSPDVRQQLVEQFKAFGFRFITLDLAGFRSGSLNLLISPEDILRGNPRQDEGTLQ